MESPAEAQSSLLPEPAPSLSTPRRQEHFSTEPRGEETYLNEIQDHLPPYAEWYSDYENSQPRSEVTPPLVKIPYKIMLDVLLEALGLPMAEYRSKQCSGVESAQLFFSTRLGRTMEMIAIAWLSLEYNL